MCWHSAEGVRSGGAALGQQYCGDMLATNLKRAQMCTSATGASGTSCSHQICGEEASLGVAGSAAATHLQEHSAHSTDRVDSVHYGPWTVLCVCGLGRSEAVPKRYCVVLNVPGFWCFWHPSSYSHLDNPQSMNPPYPQKQLWSTRIRDPMLPGHYRDYEDAFEPFMW